MQIHLIALSQKIGGRNILAIYTATALKGLRPNDSKTANSVFRGEILLQSGEIRRAFIKDLDPRQLGNELLVTALANRLGIPVPDAAIVSVRAEVSADFSKIRNASGDGFIAFASVDANGSTVAQVYEEIGSLDGPMRHITASPMLGRLYGLDTWVANVDRHSNNLIVRGDGQVFLIDHGHCFSGPSWKAEDLNANLEYCCRLRQWLTPRLATSDKDSAMADIKILIAELCTHDIVEVITESLANHLFGANDSDAVVGFLESRVAHLEKLSARALDTL